MFEEISFSEHENDSIQNYLNKLGYCYTTRVYKEIGKYKVGELYTAPWGDILKIDEVTPYWSSFRTPSHILHLRFLQSRKYIDDKNPA